jgi:hypothetical protein
LKIDCSLPLLIEAKAFIAQAAVVAKEKSHANLAPKTTVG